MTDEQLIEKAAKAIHAGIPDDRIWEDLSDRERAQFRKDARVALAVFEEAHAPTGDEREELWVEYAASTGTSRETAAVPEGTQRRAWMAGFAAGFRRSVSPEPTHEERDAGLSDAHSVSYREGFRAGRASVSPEPQGEPSQTATLIGHLWESSWPQGEQGDDRVEQSND